MTRVEGDTVTAAPAEAMWPVTRCDIEGRPTRSSWGLLDDEAGARQPNSLQEEREKGVAAGCFDENGGTVL